MGFGKFETKKTAYILHTTDQNNQVQKCPTNKRETQTLALSDSGCGETDRRKREKDGYVKIGLEHIQIQSEKRVRE
jgi:hypothetical protein